MVLQERPGDKISIWDWIKFIFTVAIPNVSSIIGNRASVVDPRLEGVRCTVFYQIGLQSYFVVHSPIERDLPVRKNWSCRVRLFTQLVRNVS